MYKIIGQLRCSVCRELVHPRDKVVLEKSNGIVHRTCYFKDVYPVDIKDEGRFIELVKKYGFLRDYED